MKEYMNRNHKQIKLNRSSLAMLEDNDVVLISKIAANATKKAHKATAKIMAESVEVKNGSIVVVKNGKTVRTIKALNRRKASIGDKLTLSY